MGSSMGVATFPAAGLLGEPPVQRILCPNLPFMAVDFLSEDAVVAAGYDFQPILFRKNDHKWVSVGSLDQKSSRENNEGASNTSGAAAARALFKAKTELGQSLSSKDKDNLSTTHSRPISTLCSIGGGRFSTAGFEGKLVVWDVRKSVSALETSMA